MNPQSLSPQDVVDRRKPGEHGQTLVLFMLMMVLLFVFVGMGVDLGLAYITKAQLSRGGRLGCINRMRNLYQGQPRPVWLPVTRLWRITVNRGAMSHRQHSLSISAR